MVYSAAGKPSASLRKMLLLSDLNRYGPAGLFSNELIFQTIYLITCGLCFSV